MDSKTRASLIREGNAAFNKGDIRKARELFLQTDYKDGLIRLGDYFMYDRKLPVLAYGYYKKAGMQAKVDEIFLRMLSALSVWLGKDSFKPGSPIHPIPEGGSDSEKGAPLDPEDFRVHPILRAKALEILKKQNS